MSRPMSDSPDTQQHDFERIEDEIAEAQRRPVIDFKAMDRHLIHQSLIGCNDEEYVIEASRYLCNDHPVIMREVYNAIARAKYSQRYGA